MKTKILPLSIILLLLLSPFTLTTYADEETGEDPPEDPVDPETLNAMKAMTEERRQELLGIFGENELPPAVMQNFMHAQQAMEEAGEKTDPQAAAQMYNRAMKQFRNALRHFYHKYPETVLDPEDPGDEPPETEGDVLPTEQEISQAKMELIMRFQERFQERMMEMYGVLGEVTENLSPQDALKAQNAIQKAERKLLRIQERLELGQFDEALEDLDEATEELDEDLGSLEDDLAAQMFRTMNKLQAKIQKMGEKHQGWGQLEDEINGLKANFNSNRNKDKDKGGNGQDNGNKPDKPDKPDMPDNPGKGGK